MRRISQRLDELETKVATHFPRPIDDETILDVLGGRIRDHDVVRDSLDKLVELTRPALNASLHAGWEALEFCAARGIDCPPTGGVLDLCVRQFLTYPHSGGAPELTDRWRDLEKRVSQWVEGFDNGSPPSLSVEEMRAYLVVMLSVAHESTQSRDGTTAAPGVLDDSDWARLIRLVGPLEILDPPDLPLLLRRDSQGRVETSWVGDRSDTWTPIDVGLDKPRYLLLARHDSVSSNPQTASEDHSPLPRRIPASIPPPLSDDEIVRSVERETGFVFYIPDVLDRTFLRIEPLLLASIIAGAQSLRIARSVGIAVSTPQTAVNQAAHIVSYSSMAEMPDDVIEACGWAIPDADHYDYFGTRLTSSRHTKGSARGALVFRALEKYGLRMLRELRLSDNDVPSASQREVESLLRLIQPLQWEPDPDLPLLLWHDSNGAIRTSSKLQGGQIRTIADMTGDNPDTLLLANPKAEEVIPDRNVWAVDHYRPDGQGWRSRQFGKKVAYSRLMTV